MILNFEHNFYELVERIQNIQTDASKNKLSDEAPLGEFVKSEEVMAHSSWLERNDAADEYYGRMI